ncbi:MAG: O-antigen ligase family protein [Planctomycetota bacterium]
MTPTTSTSDTPPDPIQIEPAPRWRLGLVDPAPGGAAWVTQRRDDPLGYALHLLCGLLALAAITLPTSIMEFALVPALIASIVRTPRLWRTWGALALQPHILALLAWVGVQALSYLWTGDRQQWLDEFGVVRFALLPLLIWPLLAHRDALILALGLGLLLGVGVQALHLIGVTLDVGWLDWQRKPGRVSGWWDPVVGGTILTAGVGLFLAPPPPALERKRWRLLVIGALMLVGVALTGTRGAWLACVGLVAVAIALALVRAANRRALLRAGAVALPVVALLAGGVWWLAGERIADRARAGYDEVSAAIEDRRFNTDTGTRLLLNWWAIEAFAERPITGVGVGGYRAWCAEHLERQDIPPDRYLLHGHAHNAALHTLATTGLMGFVPAFACVAFVLAGAFAHRDWLAPGVALVGLLLVSVFDTIHVNQQTAAVFFAIVALCPTWTPSTGSMRRTRTDRG